MVKATRVGTLGLFLSMANSSFGLITLDYMNSQWLGSPGVYSHPNGGPPVGTFNDNLSLQADDYGIGVQGQMRYTSGWNTSGTLWEEFVVAAPISYYQSSSGIESWGLLLTGFIDCPPGLLEQSMAIAGIGRPGTGTGVLVAGNYIEYIPSTYTTCDMDGILAPRPGPFLDYVFEGSSVTFAYTPKAGDFVFFGFVTNTQYLPTSPLPGQPTRTYTLDFPISFRAVPEPSVSVALGLGLFGAFLRRRHRKL